MLTIKDCKQVSLLDESALFILNKIVYDYKRAYTKSYDGQTYWDFGLDINTTLKTLKKEIDHQTFTFSPFLMIEKRLKSKTRKIYISTWRDKIIERWLNNSLNVLLSNWFTKHSYAYRTDKLGLDQCQNQILKIIKRCQFFSKRDIAEYFYTIDHDILNQKLQTLIDPDDYLYKLIESRFKAPYYFNGQIDNIKIGIPFGSSLACTLANIYLTDLDKEIIKHKVRYFRYADDFLIAGDNADEVIAATNTLDDNLKELKLRTKLTHTDQFTFNKDLRFRETEKFKFLGLQFHKSGKVTLTVEKQRKIINFYKRALWADRNKIKKVKNLDERIKMAIGTANNVIDDRIRSVAIIDYYLKHINDENKLQEIDRLIAELVISVVLQKKFKKSDFRTIKFKQLRQGGLISLLHRHRLHKHGHLKVNFMSLRNNLLIKRYSDTIDRQKNRVNQIKMARTLRKT